MYSCPSPHLSVSLRGVHGLEVLGPKPTFWPVFKDLPVLQHQGSEQTAAALQQVSKGPGNLFIDRCFTNTGSGPVFGIPFIYMDSSPLWPPNFGMNDSLPIFHCNLKTHLFRLHLRSKHFLSTCPKPTLR